MAGRRGVGVGGIQRKKDQQAKFKEKGSEMASEQLLQLSNQLESFTGKLEEFASKHRQEIKKNPQFRRHFQDMCASVGVDPLASGKGFWAEKLGVGDFYYELGVQIVEVCMATNHINGGMMTLEDLRLRLMRSRSRTRKETISNDDLLRAIEKLKVLGAGFTLIRLGGVRYLVQSVPGELSMDHAKVFELAEETGFVTKDKLMDSLKWDEERAEHVMKHLITEGMSWIDDQPETVQYWFPSLFMQLHSQSQQSSTVSSSDSGSRR